MKIKLLILLLTISLCLSLGSCAPLQTPTLTDGVNASLSLNEATLKESEDFGQKYIDSLIFLGESTTYHLKSRGVLSGGTDTKQVWAPTSGTVNLDPATKDLKIIYPNTNKQMTVAEAAAIERPEYIVMTFGLNGAVQKVNKGEDYFKRCYLSLIDSVRRSSPETKIILQSAFPVAENMDVSNYSVNLKTLNEYIDTINSWSLELAAEQGLRYLNTSEILKNENGYLAHDYQSGDGHHLSEKAYKKILTYIRTHGYM